MRLDIEPFEIRYDSEEDAWFIYGPGIMGRMKSQFSLRHQVQAQALQFKHVYLAGYLAHATD